MIAVAGGGRLAHEISGLLEALRRATGGRYACVMMTAGEIPFESAEGEPGPLRSFLETRREALFAIPGAMASGGPMADAFEDWHDDEFLLAFVNGRAAVVAACPDAEQARAGAFELVKTLADRLIRYDLRLASVAAGGIFFGPARIDLVAVGGPHAE